MTTESTRTLLVSTAKSSLCTGEESTRGQPPRFFGDEVGDGTGDVGDTAGGIDVGPRQEHSLKSGLNRLNKSNCN